MKKIQTDYKIRVTPSQSQEIVEIAARQGFNRINTHEYSLLYIWENTKMLVNGNNERNFKETTCATEITAEEFLKLYSENTENAGKDKKGSIPGEKERAPDIGKTIKKIFRNFLLKSDNLFSSLGSM